MPGIVRRPYHHQIDHRTANGATTAEVITEVTTVEAEITVGTMMHGKMIAGTTVNRMTLVVATDADEAVAEVETVVGDQGEVTRMDGNPRRKNLNRKRKP
eukprot:GHVT01010970.1.p3 GENE.GHVT01010970.1~~GHVT01010970.1.p3  ORF type:complete len:100 (-),score=1.32 GHVT01010970.1:275-574(-)